MGLAVFSLRKRFALIAALRENLISHHLAAIRYLGVRAKVCKALIISNRVYVRQCACNTVIIEPVDVLLAVGIGIIPWCVRRKPARAAPNCLLISQTFEAVKALLWVMKHRIRVTVY